MSLEDIKKDIYLKIYPTGNGIELFTNYFNVYKKLEKILCVDCETIIKDNIIISRQIVDDYILEKEKIYNEIKKKKLMNNIFLELERQGIKKFSSDIIHQSI